VGRRTLLVLVVAWFLDASGPARTAERAWVDVVVRVYDAASMAPGDKARALAIAVAALAPAELELHFAHCGKDVIEAGCEKPLRPGELALRLVRSPTAEPRAAHALPLGEALLDLHRRTGALATIYVERVEGLAHAAGGDAVVLLGRAIAHELVHAISGQGRHTPRGLMRPVWSAREVAANRSEDWRLDQADAAMLARKHAPAGVRAALR
jgi:hypothetical protein